nr:metallophosphoesterase [Sandaracinus amylolyticus]
MEHRKLIDNQGAVWWGWWRKNFEPEHTGLFERLENGGSGRILIVDRATSRAFRARFLQVRTSSSTVDDVRVPAYYRSQKDRVAAWFLLASIEDTPFDRELGERLGETTLLPLDVSEASATPSTRVSLRPRSLGRSHILHLSDLHFGADYAFLPRGETSGIGDLRRTLTNCIVEDLSRLNRRNDIGLVIVTGDFTTRGDWTDKTRGQILSEMADLLNALGLQKEDLIALPGNHDIVRYRDGATVDVAKMAVSSQTDSQHEREFRMFLQLLTGRDIQNPLNYSQTSILSGIAVTVCALNSCSITSTQWTEYGYVGTGGLDALSVDPPHATDIVATLKIMALHHHLLPVAAVEAPRANGVSLTLNAVELLDKALETGVQLVIHGHQHQARVSSYGVLPMGDTPAREPLVIVSGGSSGAAAPRLPGAERNTYSLIGLDTKGVHLWIRELRPDAKPGATLFNAPVPLVPGRAT